MKKIITLLCLGFFLVPIAFLSGCDFESEEEKDKKLMSSFLTVIENKDKDAFKNLFSKSKAQNVDNFNQSVDDFFTYIKGDYESSTPQSSSTDADNDNGKVNRCFSMSTEVKTTESTYEIAIYWCFEDSNKDNLGIWSLYVIEKSTLLHPEYTYRGDGIWTKGINFDKDYPLDEDK